MNRHANERIEGTRKSQTKKRSAMHESETKEPVKLMSNLSGCQLLCMLCIAHSLSVLIFVWMQYTSRGTDPRKKFLGADAGTAEASARDRMPEMPDARKARSMSKPFARLIAPVKRLFIVLLYRHPGTRRCVPVVD